MGMVPNVYMQNFEQYTFQREREWGCVNPVTFLLAFYLGHMKKKTTYECAYFTFQCIPELYNKKKKV